MLFSLYDVTSMSMNADSFSTYISSLWVFFVIYNRNRIFSCSDSLSRFRCIFVKFPINEGRSKFSEHTSGTGHRINISEDRISIIFYENNRPTVKINILEEIEILNFLNVWTFSNDLTLDKNSIYLTKLATMRSQCEEVATEASSNGEKSAG